MSESAPEIAVQYLKDRGGPAFPIIGLPMGDEATYSASGLTARDYFAGQALTAIMTLPKFVAEADRNADPLGSLASAAYTLADAMLKERAK